jgi:hypothetical protein
MLHCLLKHSLIVSLSIYYVDIWPIIQSYYYKVVIQDLSTKHSYQSSLSFIVIAVKSVNTLQTTQFYNMCQHCSLNITQRKFRRISYTAIFRRKNIEIKPFYNQDDYHIYCHDNLFGYIPDFSS